MVLTPTSLKLWYSKKCICANCENEEGRERIGKNVKI